MQRIEPTGELRRECYMAKLIATVKSTFSGKSHDWRKELINYEPREQTPEEMFAAFERVTKWQ